MHKFAANLLKHNISPWNMAVFNKVTSQRQAEHMAQKKIKSVECILNVTPG